MISINTEVLMMFTRYLMVISICVLHKIAHEQLQNTEHYSTIVQIKNGDDIITEKMS